jgi:hypothetical protein
MILKRLQRPELFVPNPKYGMMRASSEAISFCTFQFAFYIVDFTSRIGETGCVCYLKSTLGD